MEKTQIKVIKKDGTIAKFDEEKIKKAIRKSAERVSVVLSKEEENKVVELVYNELKSMKAQDGCEVAKVHNMVEMALSEVNKHVAESYRSYRNYSEYHHKGSKGEECPGDNLRGDIQYFFCFIVH